MFESIVADDLVRYPVNKRNSILQKLKTLCLVVGTMQIC